MMQPTEEQKLDNGSKQSAEHSVVTRLGGVKQLLEALLAEAQPTEEVMEYIRELESRVVHGYLNKMELEAEIREAKAPHKEAFELMGKLQEVIAKVQDLIEFIENGGNISGEKEVADA
jgi:hypothetical protein